MVTRVSKDFLSTVAVAYMVYKLLCLNDPARYYGKPSGDAIDIMNVAINAQQARNVFFKGFKTKVEKSPWFKGRFNAKMDSIEFDKSITVYSGHSERESHEGLNLFAAILDEISGFALESNTGNVQGKTASAIYKAFRGTVDSRFPDLGVVVLLSFPRFKDDYISQKYEEAILNKETKIRTHRFKIDNEMPDGVEGNEFDIEWEEDHIVHYRMPGVLALKRPTWEVNPTRNIEDFKHAFYTDAQDALMRFACVPPDAVSGYFSDHEKLDMAFSQRPPISEGMGFQEWFVPDKDKMYFMHADLAQSHDRAAVAMAHVGHWKHTSTVSGYNYYSPHIVVDFVQWWTPTKQRHIDLDEVRDFIVSVRRRGFNVRMVTFDRWRCLPENAPVYTPNGPVHIKDINIGDKISTRFGDSIVTDKFDSGEQEVFRITTRLGWELEATKNHKVFTNRGWITVGELNVNDKLLLNNNFSTSGDELSVDQAYVFGALIADGWINHKKDHVIKLTTADEEFVEAFDSKIKSAWGFTNKAQISVKKKDRDYYKDTYEMHYWQKDMIQKMRVAGLHRSTSHDKRIPRSVFNSSFEARAEFFAGFVDGDGGVQEYIDKNGVKRYRVTMDTISENLANDLVWLSMSLKLQPTRLRQLRKDGRIMHRLTFEGDKAIDFFNVVTPKIARKNITGLEKSSRKPRYVFDDGEMWVDVKGIVSIGTKHTYDISVDEYHEFLCGGFVVHNSVDMIAELNNMGIHAERLSVATTHYDDLKLAVMEDRISGPETEILIKELKGLQLIKGKVDHPRSGTGKDLSDAVTGAVYNAMTHTPRDTNNVEIVSLKDIQRSQQQELPKNVIKAPSDVKMPKSLADYLGSMRTI